MDFHFSTEITAFTRPLGEMSPDPFDRDPAIGDTVAIELDIAGVQIRTGVIVAEMVCSEAVSDLIWDLILDAHFHQKELGAADLQLLRANFDSPPDWPHRVFSNYLACWVHFEVEVPTQLAAQVARELGSGAQAARLSEAIEPSGDRLVVGLVQHGGRSTLVGHARCLVCGVDVQSTSAIDAFKAHHAASREVEHVAWSDQAAPAELWCAINADIDHICEQEPADYHPGSGGVVRDIVHPSLYCYVSGVSRVHPWMPWKSPFAKPAVTANKDFWGRALESSRYQWLPAEVQVTKEGHATFESDINNLSRARYPQVYRHLEALFATAFPLLEAVCSHLRNDFCTTGLARLESGAHQPITIPLRNRRLQVVTKIVEYRVNAEAQFDGTWHVEGMAHEHILATALCIVKRDSHFDGAEIEFRRYLFAQEGDDLVRDTPQNALRPTDTMGGGDVRPLGCMETPAGRIIVFPNSHIHRVGPMRSTSGQDAVRRIVVFWLVNPEQRILSTRNVAAQQGVMPHDQALAHRLQLMDERMRHKETYAEREVFLCEH